MPDVAPIPPVPKKKNAAKKLPRRLVSLDAYRGFIMTMLAASGFGIARLASLPRGNSVWNVWDYDSFQRLRFHFSHPPWESIVGTMGVSFWDMIQPCFMFMVGVAMPFSYARRSRLGSTRFRQGLHAFIRSVVLVLMGVFLYSLSQPQTNWIFTNVLAQIGLGYFFAYLFLDRSKPVQLAGIGVILVGYWGLYVMNPPPDNFDYAAVKADVAEGEVYEGRFAPWSKNSNVGYFFDLWFLNQLRMPAEEVESDTSNTAPVDREPTTNDEDVAAADGDKAIAEDPVVADAVATAPVSHIRQWWFSSSERFEFNRGGYLTLNFVPSIATMLLGVLCGQLLMTTESNGRKMLQLVVWGGICLGLGILAHHSVCPIVKRIWTPSWTLFSGGYAIWMLAGFYLLFDVLPLQKLAFPLVVVGMNSIVMYLMGQMLRPWIVSKVVSVHFAGLLTTFFGTAPLDANGMGAMIAPTAAFVVFWLIAFWLYRNRYFVRI